MVNKYTSIEICAGAGGQALGLEQAGFEHVALVEFEHLACQTLRYNRPNWNVIERDVRAFSATKFNDVDLFAGGVPCPPFSVAGKQLGKDDERDLFPEAIRLIKECRPKAVMLENVKGILSKKFEDYRKHIIQELISLGYNCSWKLINSSDYGVSQLRPRAILIAMREEYFEFFSWPEKDYSSRRSIGELLFDEISSLGWDAANWANNAKGIAPTLVGGSKKHGGADLGPTRAKQAWAEIGINGKGLADAPPLPGFNLMPKLTLQMTALVQGFPENWKFAGKKTPAYRQVGNAFPPPVARAIGQSIFTAFELYERNKTQTKRFKGEAA
ncbi:DNA cytosine methyltransferase [Mucilaginibacter glaciei]|uniref:Cytosine-specific methyltransferase n=1 Tax=Mucilaginibacter glaciei TaxID=2772109 RepID=A0A926NRP1_9SPHI|nr:DNA cytosine methyltransferase [Mucilaginibacter glaciei]MBD1393485.1 DNA cytosine methyltransferase [Mucilaginibacter glaciei]